MLTGLVTTVARPVASRVVTTAVARTVRPPADTSKRPSPITRQPRAQRAARARARRDLDFSRGALSARRRTTVPWQPPAAIAGQASGTGSAGAPAGSSSGAVASIWAAGADATGGAAGARGA